MESQSPSHGIYRILNDNKINKFIHIYNLVFPAYAGPKSTYAHFTTALFRQDRGKSEKKLKRFR